MAVYTQIGTRELTGFIETYDIGALLSCKGIAEGVENSNYLLSTAQGRFILTLYEKRVNPDDLPFFLGLMEHLAANGVPCPVPVHDREGKALRHLAGRPAAMVSFLDGMSVHRPQNAHCRELGRAMAKLHVAGGGFALERPNSLSVAGWRELFEKTAPHLEDIAPGLEGEIGAELAFLEDNWPSHLPRGIIHADLFPDNVFYIGKTLSGVIDFYFACRDTLAYDLAICLNAWCFEAGNAFNITKARAILRGYQEERRLNGDEINALPLLARGAALRFFLTRAYDRVNTPDDALVAPKNPREYLDKLRFHRSVKSAAGYGMDF